MHLLLVILGVLSVIGVWAWRLRMARRGLEELGRAADTLANAPRRMRFRYLADRGGVDLIEDPREAAAIMMMLTALARGDALTDAHGDIIEAEIRDNFGLSAIEAEELAAHAAWAAQTIATPESAMRKLSRLILNAPGLGPKEIVDLDAMLVSVSEAEGLPVRDQLLLLQTYRDLAGLKT